MARGRFEIEGRPLPPAERPNVRMQPATPGYFDALGIRILRGRPFTDADRAGAHWWALRARSARCA